MNYEELIERRESIRKYHDKAVSDALIDEITAYFTDSEKLIPELEVSLTACKGMADRLEGVVGYQGNAFHAPLYFVIASAEHEHMYMNAGFLGENLILKMTDLGLSSCWLTIEDVKAARAALRWTSDLIPAAIIACGYGFKEEEGPRLDIKTMSDVKVSSRKGHIAPKISLQEIAYKDKWGQMVKDWTSDEVDPDQGKGLYAASLAPSLLNRQAYRFIDTGNYLYLIAKSDDIQSDEDQRLDLGAAMLNFRIVYKQYNALSKNWSFGADKTAAELGAPEEYETVATYTLF